MFHLLWLWLPCRDCFMEHYSDGMDRNGSHSCRIDDPGLQGSQVAVDKFANIRWHLLVPAENKK